MDVMATVAEINRQLDSYDNIEINGYDKVAAFMTAYHLAQAVTLDRLPDNKNFDPSDEQLDELRTVGKRLKKLGIGYFGRGKELFEREVVEFVNQL